MENYNEKQLLAELTANGESKKNQLCELFAAYEIAKLGYEAQTQMEYDIYDRVLAENEFFCEMDSAHGLIKAGDRVTSHKYDYLMSNKDFDKMLDLALPLFVEAGLTDAEGNYTTDWVTMELDALKALACYIVDEVVPASMRKDLEQAKINPTYQLKLVDIFRSCVKGGAR